jgi:hypothetical protein
MATRKHVLDRDIIPEENDYQAGNDQEDSDGDQHLGPFILSK